jgi:hypothetical protein
MFRFVFYVILIYLIYRFVRVIIRMINTSSQYNEKNIDFTEKQNHEKNGYNIKQKDIIDADFHEIKDDEEKKS